MTDTHIKRGFLDDSRLDNIAVRSFETSTSVGQVIKSQRERETETAAESNISNGQPHQATDTQGDWKEQGLIRCNECGIAKEEKEFRVLKVRGVEYLCKNCRPCEVVIARKNRFSNIIPVDPYPARLE